MKKLVCILSILVILFVGGTAVFADPHGEPGTGHTTDSEPVVTEL